MSTLTQAVRSRGFVVVVRDGVALVASIAATIAVLTLVSSLVERWS